MPSVNMDQVKQYVELSNRKKALDDEQLFQRRWSDNDLPTALAEPGDELPRRGSLRNDVE